MKRRSRTASTLSPESRLHALSRPPDPDPGTALPPPPGAPVPPPPYAEPEPYEGPQVRYEDDGSLAPPPPDPPPTPLSDPPRASPAPSPPPSSPPPSLGPGEAPDPPPGRSAARPEARAHPPPGSGFVPYAEEDHPGPLSRLRNLVSGDELDPGRPGLRVLLVVGVLAVLLGGWYWWRSRPTEEPLPAPAPAGSPAARPQPMPGTPTASPSATAVVVDVAGKVRHPGVVRLPSGSRVVDAIDAAGGVKPGARAGPLNLARVLVDGEQILVGASSTPAVPTPLPSSGASASGSAVSLNTATEEQLDTLPGVGPVLAKHILDYRTQHGGFRSIDELQDVTGIGPKRFADLKPQVTL